MGLAACLLIIMYVKDELSYDRFNKNAARIYRVDPDIKFGGSVFQLATAPAIMSETLLKDYPQIEAAVRFRVPENMQFKKGNDRIMENRLIYTDPSIFKIFTLPVIDGNPQQTLAEPNTVVLTESTARKYFNRTNVAGQIIETGDNKPLKIAGVIKDIPENSHFNFDIFFSMAGLEEARRDNWLSNNFNTYILLKEGANAGQLNAELRQLVTRYVAPQLKEGVNSTLEEMEKRGEYVRYSLTPLLNIHLHSDRLAELSANSNIVYVYIFSAVALFILLIACVNFMNLSTARSSNRSREVGIRKVMGSMRWNLITQFLAESMLISFVSLILALVLAWISLPWFNQLAGKSLNMESQLSPVVALVLIGFAALVGLLAGSYPAFFLSSFQPIKVLKGKLAAGFKTGWLRNSLVVFQFSISIFLIVGTVVIYNQLNYIRNKNTGFNRDQVLILNNTQVLKDKLKTFREELLASGAATQVTVSGYLPTGSSRNTDVVFKEATAGPDASITLQLWQVDENYIPTLGMQMAAGRNFSKDLPTDSNAVIINESAAKLLGYKDPLNKFVYMPNGRLGSINAPYSIVGVVKDFNFNSMRESVSTLLLQFGRDKDRMAVKLKAGDIQQSIQRIEGIWKSMVPQQPLAYSFMDEDFNAIYQAEQRTGKISMAFSILAVLIACLGLFGLAAYAAEQRTKEIGIRKVLGASVSGIIQMLSKDFLKLVAVAVLIAVPFAWWAMNSWLNNFAYRTQITWWVFAGTALITLLIALLTVSFQAIRAALANPVQSLKNE